jgi:HK97 gp10 family phage protein
MSAVVVIDEAALTAMFTRSDGPVAKALTSVAIKVERVAKRLVAVDTGYLRSSIGWTLVIIEGLLAALIGSSVTYALAQEAGTWKMPAHPFLRPALASVLRLAPA